MKGSGAAMWMTRQGRLRLGVLLAVFMLVLADYAIWLVATRWLDTGWRDWQERLPAEGWRVEARSAQVTGWPFAARMTLADAHLAQRGAAGLGWSAGRVTFGVSLFQPHLLSIAVAGPQRIAAFGYAPLEFSAQHLEARVLLTSPIQSARVFATGLAMTLPAGVVTVSQADLRVAWDAGGARLVIAAGPAALPPSATAGPAPTIDQVTLDLAAEGAWAGGDAGQAATAWRDAGGRVVVRQADLRWGGLTLDATGDARLDAALQPDAALDVRVSDPAAALTALRATGAIDQGTAEAAGAVLQILAIPAKLAGQTGALDLPLALHGGAVTLARIPVATMPKVRW